MEANSAKKTHKHKGRSHDQADTHIEDNKSDKAVKKLLEEVEVEDSLKG